MRRGPVFGTMRLLGLAGKEERMHLVRLLIASFCLAFSIATLVGTASAADTSFWKTHASCAPGNHQPALDEGLFALGGIFVGSVELSSGTTPGLSPDCVTAVDIVTKRTVDGATKEANDPLFNVAAQFLAAELTQASGGPACVAAAEAAADAEALLDRYAWNGITYAGPMTPTDATAAARITDTLAKYNKGKLC